MDQHDVILEVADLLEQHVASRPDALSTAPYRQHVFRLFKESYPELSADTLRDAILEEWLTRHGRVDEAHHQSLAHLTLAWSEWRYAWDKYEIRLVRSSHKLHPEG